VHAGSVAALLVFVRLSSERARQAVRQECSFAKKHKSPSVLLVVVEAVAYIGGDAKRFVSRRLICLEPSPEALRTAHMASPL
jgi:hypothetical protein